MPSSDSDSSSPRSPKKKATNGSDSDSSASSSSAASSSKKKRSESVDSSRSTSESEPIQKKSDSESESSKHSSKKSSPKRKGSTSSDSSSSSASSKKSSPKKKGSDSSRSPSPPKKQEITKNDESSVAEPAPKVEEPSPAPVPEPIKVVEPPKAAAAQEAAPLPPSSSATAPPPQPGQPGWRNSFKGIPLDLTAIKKAQETEAKGDKLPHFSPGGDSSSSSRSSVSSSSSKSKKTPVSAASNKSSAVSKSSRSRTPSPPPAAKPPPAPVAVPFETKPANRPSSKSSSSSSSPSPPPRKEIKLKGRAGSDSESSKSSNSSAARDEIRRGDSSSSASRRSPSPSSRTSSVSPKRQSRSRSRSSRSSSSGRKKRSGSLSNSSSRSDVSTSSYSFDSGSEHLDDATKKRKFQLEKDIYTDLPEPSNVCTLKVTSDQYLKPIQENIDSLHHYIRCSVQRQEELLMDQFSFDLRKCNGAANDREEEERRHKFLRDLEELRNSRKQFRGVLYDAITERDNILKSKALSTKNQRELEEGMENLNRPRLLDLFTVLFFIFQVLLILFFLVFVDYSPASDELSLQNVATYYRFYTGVAFTLFVGYAFLGAFMRKYSYSALSFVFLLGALAIQWGILWNYWWQIVNAGSVARMQLAIPDLINGVYTAVACSFSFAMVLGHTSAVQGLVMVFFECFFYALNIYINRYQLLAIDIGDIHMFGAFFGLGVTWVLFFKKGRTGYVENLTSNQENGYNHDLLAMIGTMFLWVLWPSFNAALAAPADQARAIINTVLAMAISTVVVASYSRMRRTNGISVGFSISDFRTATLAGGVGVAAAASLAITPWGALLTGLVTGLVAVIVEWRLIPIMQRHRVIDTRSVFTLHGFPGIVGAIVCAIAATSAVNNTTTSFDKYIYQDITAVFPRQYVQGGIQIAALFITMFLSWTSGTLTGMLMYWMRPKARAPYADEDHFHVLTREDYPE